MKGQNVCGGDEREISIFGVWHKSVGNIESDIIDGNSDMADLCKTTKWI